MLYCWNNLDVFFSDKLVVVWKACSNGLIVYVHPLLMCFKRCWYSSWYSLLFKLLFSRFRRKQNKTKVTTNCCSNNSSEGPINIHKNDESSIRRDCFNHQHQHQEVHQELKKCCTPLHTVIDIEPTTMHACMSVEKRELNWTLTIWGCVLSVVWMHNLKTRF
jgi:hypothetical protein